MKEIHFMLIALIVTTINCALLDEVNVHRFMFQYGNIPAIHLNLKSPMYMRIVVIAHTAAFDALTPYLPNATGFYSKIPKFNANQWTNRNKNIAAAYALYRTHVGLNPAYKPGLDDVMNRLGLDPNDQSLDLRTPIGVGNYAAKNALNARLNDGMNQEGNANGKKYNGRPYEDYTDFVPKNDAFDLKNIGNWQPNILPHPIALGEFFVQTHSFPQYAKTKAFSINPAFYSSPPPSASSSQNPKRYKKQVDEVLQESYNLNDRKKMISEYFDRKASSLVAPLVYLGDLFNQTSVEETVTLLLVLHLASHDAGIVVWREKLRHNSVRPFSAIRYLYGNKNISAWGGVGKGSVNDITGKEWKSYISPANEAEYPSATACYCAAQMQAASLFFNTKSLFGFKFVNTKFSSLIEPGITPATDVTLGPYNTFQEYVDECANSGLYGGTHFRAAIEEGKRLCKPIGEAAYKFLKKHL